MNRDGGWLFISHSHKDVDIVRLIRNGLEARGFEPLMFYLKALSDEDEIEGLIKREIEAREWFVYVDSENARNSKWVSSERAYVESLPDKKVFTFDIDGSVDEQVERISRQLKVLVSCQPCDVGTAHEIRRALECHDYITWLDVEPTFAKNSWQAAMYDGAMQSIEAGFALLLIGERTTGSDWAERKATLLLEKGCKIIPVYIGDSTIDEGCTMGLALNFASACNRCMRISENPTDDELERLVKTIESQIEF